MIICCVCIFATNRRKLKLTNKTTTDKSDTTSTTKFETPYSLLPLVIQEEGSSQRNQADSQIESQKDKNSPQQSEVKADPTDPISASHDQQQESHDTDSLGDQQPLITDPAKPSDGQQPPGPIAI